MKTLSLVLLCLSAAGCGLFKGASGNFTTTVNGQTITGTLDADGTECTTFSPPLRLGNELCSQECVGPKIGVQATCTAVGSTVSHLRILKSP